MRYIALCFAVLIVFSVTGLPQNRTFRWTDEACSYTGIYDPAKISATILINTLKLVRPGSFNLETNTTVWKLADIDRLDVAGLDREYKQKSTELAGLVIAKTPYWEEFRQRKLKELAMVYRLNRASMLAYRDRKALLQFTDAPGCTTRFANPLIAGGSELLTTWKTLNEEERKKNVDPERLKRIFDQQFSSPDRMNYALLEVMTFGWSNCANDVIDYVTYDGTPEKEFEKLFISARKLRCNEP